MTSATSLSAALATALMLSVACTATGPLGPPDDGELADLGVAAVPAYAATLSTTLNFCEKDGDQCDPDGETSWFTVELQVAVDVSGPEAIVLPCSARGFGEDKDFEFPTDRVRKVPSGAAQTRLDGKSLDLRLALPLGIDLDDPFAADVDLEAAASDHEGDGEVGLTFDHWLGRVFFGGRVMLDLTGIDVTAEFSEADAALVGLDYAIFDDTIPFVNVRKKVRKYFEDNMQSGEDSTATVQIIEAPTCADVDAVLQ